MTHNPVDGVKRPPVESYKGKTPALGDDQARQLLNFPSGESLKDKRDRALLATLLYHGLRRSELCKLKVRDVRQQRRGVLHLKISGKARFVPLHPAASRLLVDYLDVRYVSESPLLRKLIGAAQERARRVERLAC